MAGLFFFEKLTWQGITWKKKKRDSPALYDPD
jgi:hypothetical protein